MSNTQRTEPTPIKISQTMSLGKASVLLAAMIALSRVAGYGRLVLTSTLYGISPETDAYNAAFNIPDTVSILVAGGALATGFVPVFTQLLAKGDEEGARRTFRAMFTLLLLGFGALTIILFALTYSPWKALLAPQKVGPETVELYLHTLRILLFAQFIFVMGGLFTGALNALRLFWFPALQPLVFNLGIIAFGIVLPQTLGWGIESQAWGALVGAIVGSVFIQAPAVWRNGLSMRPLLDLSDPGVRKVLLSLGPIIFGLSSGQLIALSLPRFFAVGAVVGDLTALDNANRLMQVPVALLASGPAIALYPTLSMLHANNDRKQLQEHLMTALRRTLLFMIMATALLMALREPIIRLLLQHGKFDAADTAFTAKVLLFYSAGLVGLGVQQILARGFYAMNETRPPVIIGVATMTLFCVLAALVVNVTNWGAFGLALAATSAISILGFVMWLSLRSRFDSWDDTATTELIWKCALAAFVAYAAAFASQTMLASVLAAFDAPTVATTLRLLTRALVLLISAFVGIIGFLLILRMLKLQEAFTLFRRKAKS